MQNVDPKRWLLETWFTDPQCHPSETRFPHEARKCSNLGLESPPAVIARQRWYWDRTEGFGGAWILMYDPSVDPRLAGRVFLLVVGTDGDEGAAEVFDADGALWGCAYVDTAGPMWETPEGMDERFPELEW